MKENVNQGEEAKILPAWRMKRKFTQFSHNCKRDLERGQLTASYLHNCTLEDLIPPKNVGWLPPRAEGMIKKFNVTYY